MDQFDEQVRTCINGFIPYLVSVYRIPGHTEDDLKQIAYTRAIAVLKKRQYDNSRELKNYLFIAIRNHFLNLLRRYKLEKDMKSLSDLCEDDHEEFAVHENPLDKITYQELIQHINKKLAPEYRSDFLRLLENCKLKPERKREIQVAIAEIITEIDFDFSDKIKKDLLEIYNGK